MFQNCQMQSSLVVDDISNERGETTTTTAIMNKQLNHVVNANEEVENIVVIDHVFVPEVDNTVDNNCNNIDKVNSTSVSTCSSIPETIIYNDEKEDSSMLTTTDDTSKQQLEAVVSSTMIPLLSITPIPSLLPVPVQEEGEGNNKDITDQDQDQVQKQHSINIDNTTDDSAKKNTYTDENKDSNKSINSEDNNKQQTTFERNDTQTYSITNDNLQQQSPQLFKTNDKDDAVIVPTLVEDQNTPSDKNNSRGRVQQEREQQQEQQGVQIAQLDGNDINHMIINEIDAIQSHLYNDIVPTTSTTIVSSIGTSDTHRSSTTVVDSVQSTAMNDVDKTPDADNNNNEEFVSREVSFTASTISSTNIDGNNILKINNNNNNNNNNSQKEQININIVTATPENNQYSANNNPNTTTSKTNVNDSSNHNNTIPLTTATTIPMRTTSDMYQQSTDDILNNQQQPQQQRIRLGICAMDKKAKSKPMNEILQRFDTITLYEIIYFGDDCLLNKPINEWPICDVLIAFFSKGYPIEKVKQYANTVPKYNLNNLDMQIVLQDRRRVYDLLEESGIDVPKHVYLSTDGYVSTGTGDGNLSQLLLAQQQQQQEQNQNSVDETVQDADDATPKSKSISPSKKQQQQMQQELNKLYEYDDHIEVNGKIINKPFVEKPVNAEDHNICIYYPCAAGGGCKKLFRKIGNRSSEFYPNITQVRNDGSSYIYEEFVETQGTDVKMYTVGPGYGHAEARKSPTVDGKVQRNADGKEIRFPVILTYREKEIARRIVLVFKQFVCGFDILRVEEPCSLVSYVCDVNGWSFVKNSSKYYDDCAHILQQHILSIINPESPKLVKHSKIGKQVISRELTGEIDISDDNIDVNNKNQFDNINTVRNEHRIILSTQTSLQSNDIDDALTSATNDASLAAATLVDGALHVREFPDNLTVEPASIPRSSTVGSILDQQDSCTTTTADLTKTPTRAMQTIKRHEELRCVLAIIRHGDRTPKQKIKVNMSDPHVLEYFHSHVKNCKKDLKVKEKSSMVEFLNSIREAVAEIQQNRTSEKESLRYHLMHIRDVLERWKIAGLNRKLQMKPRKFEDYIDETTGLPTSRCTEVQLILKWGGNLTKLGEKQAISLGQRLRAQLYPDEKGGGILRLHSTFRHDLKIKTSDEGRVMKTAAAFAKGMLELEGDLPPILVSLVHKDKGSMRMLDQSGNKEVKTELDDCKTRIENNMQLDIDIGSASEVELERLYGPNDVTSIRAALRKVGNPRKMLVRIYETMGELIRKLDEMLDAADNADEDGGGEGLKGETDDDQALSGVKLYKGETLLELTERWRFIYERLSSVDDDNNMHFDLSKIPDIHDNVRFDLLHNPHIGLTDIFTRLYGMAKPMADCVVPQEYGTTIQEKQSVGVKICRGLLEKSKFDLSIARVDNEIDMRYFINTQYSDLKINSTGRRIRTRLYFTSESHLHTVLNVLRFGTEGYSGKSVLSPEGIKLINDTPEICYLTQIIVRVFEDNRVKVQDDPKRFRVEILFSPGATATPQHETDRDVDTSRFDTAPLQMIGRRGLTCEELEWFFEHAIQAGKPTIDEDIPGGVDDDDDEVVTCHSTIEHRVSKYMNEKNRLATQASGDSIYNIVNSTSDQVEPASTKVPLAESISKVDETLPTAITSNAVESNDTIGSDWQVIDVMTHREQGEDDVATIKYTTHEEKDADDDNHGNTNSNNEDDDNKDIAVVTPGRKNIKRALSWDELDDERIERILQRKVFWNSVAIGSFVLGATCLLFAFQLSHSDDSSGSSNKRHGGSNAAVRRWATSGR